MPHSWTTGTTTEQELITVMKNPVHPGHARISPNLAVRLEEAGVGTARAWLAMQSAYDLAVERATGMPKVRKLDAVA